MAIATHYLDDFVNAAEVGTANSAYELSQDQRQPKPAMLRHQRPDNPTAGQSAANAIEIILGRVLRLAPVFHVGYFNRGFARTVEFPRFAHV